MEVVHTPPPEYDDLEGFVALGGRSTIGSPRSFIAEKYGALLGTRIRVLHYFTDMVLSPTGYCGTK
jgi:hypothetical protein